MKKATYQLVFVLLFAISCGTQSESTDNEEEARIRVEMVTTKGTMEIELYNETPQHRDNFIKLTEGGTLDSLLFHRVINAFMIQGGDPDSKYAQPNDTLGNGGLDYRIPAEFHPDLFHKKGVLAAARDGNPERASSSIQFYLVQGKVFNDSLLNHAETRINGWLAEHYVKQDTANKELVSALQEAIDKEDFERYKKLNNSLKELASDYEGFEKYTIPEAHREVYKTLGGTPHLDQNYTVYGEVVKGLSVIDSVAAVNTNNLNRPLEDVRILSVKVIK